MKPKLQRTMCDNGTIFQDQWMIERLLHRDDGPAFVAYGKNNDVLYEGWMFYGEPHCLTGPARIWYENGKVDKVSWWVNGTEMHLAQWGRHTDLDWDALVELKLLYC